MQKLIWIVCFALAVGALGCSPADEPLSADSKAAAAPKTNDQLPGDMPPEARAAANAGAGQASVAQQQGNDPARVRAMQEMQKQRGN